MDNLYLQFFILVLASYISFVFVTICNLWFDFLLKMGLCCSTRFDHWLDKGLIPIVLNAKVGDFLHPSGTWNQPCNFRDLVEQVQLTMAEIGREDRVTWLPCHFDVFSIVNDQESLHPRHLLVPWFDLLWFEGNIPRHSFIVWLAIWNRLQSCDYVCRWCFNTPSLCVMCTSGLESSQGPFIL